MLRRYGIAVGLLGIVFGLGIFVGQETRVWAQSGKNRVFELRMYTLLEGKQEEEQRIMRNHALKLFEKNGMQNIGYWVPTDAPQSQNMIIYMLAHESRDAAKKSWEAFRADPGFAALQEIITKEGRTTAKVESIFLKPTDFSPMK